jgi:hypothetical protein
MPEKQYIFVGIIVKRLFFRDILFDQTVSIFVQTSLQGGVWMSKKYSAPGFLAIEFM